MKKNTIISGTAALILSVCIQHASAQTVYNWIGGSGSGKNWNLAANWSGSAVPVAPGSAGRFLDGATAQINVADGSSSQGLRTQGNTLITLTLAATTPGNDTLYISEQTAIGQTAGASILQVEGAGAIGLTSIAVGANAVNSGGNKLIFTDGVMVNARLANASTVIGRFGVNNELVVSGQANATLDNIDIGWSGGNGNNRLTVTGANTLLTVNGGGSTRGIRIGTGSAGTDYATGMNNNYMQITEGGRMIVTSTSANSTPITVGTQANAHENYILIEGENSTLELSKGSATGAGTTLTIGDNAATNRGGNYLEVKDGGILRSGEVGHTGAITIYGHNTSGTNDGSNYLLVGNNGTVDINGNVDVSGGLLRLSASGDLSAANVTVSNGGRFEATGDGLTTTGSVAINNGELEVGFSGDMAAAVLTLSSTVNLANSANAGLKMSIYGASSADEIEFAGGGLLSIGTASVFHLTLEGYAPVFGDSWALFTGLTSGISGNFVSFDLPTLSGGLEWSTTAFNEMGGWTVSVVPEPSVLSLLLLAAGCLHFRRRRTGKVC